MSDGPFIVTKSSPPKKRTGGVIATGAVAAAVAASMLGGSAPVEDYVAIQESVKPRQVLDLANMSGDYLLRITGDSVTVETVQVLTVNPSPPVPPGPNPTPPTPVPPTPTPTPPTPVTVPDGVHGLTKLAYTEAMRIAAADRAKAPAFGENFSAVSAQLASGAYLSIAPANDDLKARNANTLGTNREPWLPWFAAEAARMQELATSRQATTRQEIADCYRAIADGLKLVK